MLILVVAGSAVAAKTGRMTANEKRAKALKLLEKYSESQKKIKSSIVKFEHEYWLEKGDGYKANGGHIGEIRSDGERSYFDSQDWRRGDSVLPNSKVLAKASHGHRIFMWTGQKMYQYLTTFDPANLDTLYLNYTDSSGDSNTFHAAFRDRALRGFVVENDYKRIDIGLKQTNAKISLQNSMEQINGSKCYVIQARSKDTKYKIWIDPKHGYNIAQAEVSRGGNLVRSGKNKYASVHVYLRNVRFEKIDDLWIPMEADYGYERKKLKKSRYLKEANHIKRTEFVLNPDHDALGSFKPDYIRNGTEVHLIGVPGIRYTWEDGKVVDYDGNVVEKMHTGASLVGKHLPDLTGFVIEPRIEQTGGIRLLVCFFDMNQRPSRHCVGQLNERAEQLREQGVFVVCVQASQLAKKELNDWRKKNRISLPIGMVDNDGIKTKQQWAVQSLPWLILTDKNKTVIAEGFRLHELDEKLKAIGVKACFIGQTLCEEENIEDKFKELFG